MADNLDTTSNPETESCNRQFLAAYARWTGVKHRFAVLNASPDDVPEDTFNEAVSAATDDLHLAAQAIAEAPAYGQMNLRKKLEVLEGMLTSGCMDDGERFALPLTLSIKADLHRHSCEAVR